MTFSNSNTDSMLGLHDGNYYACTAPTPQGKHFDIVLDSATKDPVALMYSQGVYCNDYMVILLERFTPQAGRVLDLGAHIGTFSLAAATYGHQVISVDASPKHIDLLQRSVIRNTFQNVQVVHRAISEKREKIRFLPNDLWGMIAYPGMSGDMIEVDAITTGELLAESGWDQLDFIKMDIEGSEMAALHGMPDILSKPDAPAILHECNGLTLPLYGLETRDLLKALESYGYQNYRISWDSFLFHPCSPDDLQPEPWIDLIALKPKHEEMVRQFITAPLSASEIIKIALEQVERTELPYRLYIAKALQQASPEILNNECIKAALFRLTNDPNEEVRNACAWWKAE